MVCRKVRSIPDLFSSPVSFRTVPERVFRIQAQRKEYGAAEVKAAAVDIGFRKARLAAKHAGKEPSFPIKHIICAHDAADHRSQRTAHLGRRHFRFQKMLKRSL